MKGVEGDEFPYKFAALLFQDSHYDLTSGIPSFLDAFTRNFGKWVLATDYDFGNLLFYD